MDHLAFLAEKLKERLLTADVAAVMRLQDFFGACKGVEPVVFKIATACSGTDVVMCVFNTLQTLFGEFGIRVRFEHVFSADIKEASRSFIQKTWFPEVFGLAPSSTSPVVTCHCMWSGYPAAIMLRSSADPAQESKL